MDYHKKALANLCRIYGYRALKHQEIKKGKKAKLAIQRNKQIRLLFSIDTERDNEDFHPKVMFYIATLESLIAKTPTEF